MNTDTGKVYTSPEDIAAAARRGENLAPVSERVANAVGRFRTQEAKRLRKLRAKRRRATQRASRKANR